MHSGDLSNVLPSVLHFHPSAVEFSGGSCLAPTRDAAMEVLVEELGMWKQEEVLP